MLTNGTDNIVGTSGNDTIVAGTQAGTDALNAGDQINGGAGTDTMNIYAGAANFAAATVQNVEIINVYEDANLDVSANSGVQQVWSLGGAGKTITGTVAQTIGFGNAATGGASVATFTNVAGSADAATIAVKDAGKTTAYTSITVAGIETLTVNATGTNQLGTLTAAAASKLVFTGAGAVTTTLSDAALYKTIDGSAATGALTITASGTTVSDQVLDIKTGSGNDEYVTLFANLSKEDKIDLGAGTDTLTFADTTNLSASVATLAGVTNVEILKVTAGDFLVNGDLVSQTTFNHSSTGTFTGTNIASTDKLVVGGVNTGNSTVAMKLGQTTFNLDLAGSKAAAADASTLTVTGASTINVNSTGTAGVANNNLELTTDSNGTINVTGSQNLTLTAAVPGGSTTGLTINASTFTGKATITGSAQGDAITGGSGADTLTGGLGADTLTGGAGADTFAFAKGSTGGVDGTVIADVITDFVVGTDKLQFTTVGEVVSGQQAAVQAAVTALAAGASQTAIINAMLTANTTANGVSFATYGGDTYVLLEGDAAGDTFVLAEDVFIKLAGVTTIPTFAADVVA